MQPYFAYGLNVDPEHMARRCPGSVLVGPARLPGHRFIVTRAGYGSVVRDPAAGVYGVVWRLGESNERSLDEYEGVREGLYRKERLRVYAGDGARPVEALIYVARDGRPGAPRPGYLEAVVRAARRQGFPAAYLNELERWLPGRDR